MNPPSNKNVLTEAAPWAAAIKARRADVVGSQEALALRADISQSLVSQMERGVHSPTSLSIDRFAQFLDALNWTASEFCEATGINISPTLRGPDASTKTSARPGDASTDRSIPRPLQEAVRMYGKRYTDLQDATWQHYLAGFRWRDGQPQEPEAWLDLYRDLIRAGVIPGHT